MENSYSNQLETIKTIQYNLLSLKSRLNFFQKEQSRSNQRIEKIFDSAIPIIKSKLQETHYITKSKKFFDQLAQSKLSKEDHIKASKVDHRNEMDKNKLEIAKAKAHGSFHIREMSKKNQKAIDQAKKEWIQEKKKKSQLVKACRLESRKKIEDFYIQKRNDLKKMREEESEGLEQKIQDISHSFGQISKIEAEYQKKYSKNQKTLMKLQKLVNYLNVMKPEVFNEIKEDIGLTEEDNLTDDLIQRILIEAERKSKSSKPQVLRLSLDETKRKLNQYKPNSTTKSIHVYAAVQKIR